MNSVKILFCGIISLSALANFSAVAAPKIHFTKYRFFMDEDNRKNSFKVFNKGSIDSSCKISLTHFSISDSSQFERVDNAEEAHNPAHKLIRYSPRNVTVKAGESQAVKLTFRRIPGLADGEYTSYMRLTCEENDEVTVKGVPTLRSRINYNLPVVIRNGELQVSGNIDRAVLKQNSVDVTLSREGNRSLIGDFAIIGRETGKIYAEQKSIGLYEPASSLVSSIKLPIMPNEPLRVTFMENKKSGDVTISSDIAK